MAIIEERADFPKSPCKTVIVTSEGALVRQRQVITVWYCYADGNRHPFDNLDMPVSTGALEHAIEECKALHPGADLSIQPRYVVVPTYDMTPSELDYVQGGGL